MSANMKQKLASVTSGRLLQNKQHVRRESCSKVMISSGHLLEIQSYSSSYLSLFKHFDLFLKKASTLFVISLFSKAVYCVCYEILCCVFFTFFKGKKYKIHAVIFLFAQCKRKQMHTQTHTQIRNTDRL